MNRSGTIYIAEDNPILLQGLGRALAAHGYRVECAAGGEEVLRMLAASPAAPDLILLDVMMPGLSGLDVLQELKRDPRLCPVPVVLVTAGTDENLPVRALQLGAVDVMIKPFRLRELIARISAHIERYTELRELRAELARAREADDHLPQVAAG